MRITLDIPDHLVLDGTVDERGRRIKLYAAVLMFRAGEISAGAACEIAELDRFTFAAECQKHGIPLIDYPPEELRAEVDSLRSHGI